MTEPSVQIQVSLIERIGRMASDTSAFSAQEWDDLSAVLAAILSQPTAERWQDRPHEAREDVDDYSMCLCGSPVDVPLHVAAPPSIADMVPGTTFTAQVRGFTNPVDWEVLPYVGGGVFARSPSSWRWCSQHDIDPSTIRDVTPPR